MNAPSTVDGDDLLVTAGHHPLDHCEQCGRPVPEVRVECANPDCQAKTRERDLYFVDRYADADEQASYDQLADIVRREDA